MLADGAQTVITRLMEEHNALIEQLPAREVSIKANAAASFRKTLLLSAASYFEVRMSDAVTDAFSEATDHSDALVGFVRSKAIERRYHDWFDWNARNANRFFSAFGSGFRSFMQERTEGVGSRQESIRAFLEIGKLRNQLVHENFASYYLDKTVDEIYQLYEKAIDFVDAFLDDLREYLRR